MSINDTIWYSLKDFIIEEFKEQFSIDEVYRGYYDIYNPPPYTQQMYLYKYQDYWWISYFFFVDNLYLTNDRYTIYNATYPEDILYPHPFKINNEFMYKAYNSDYFICKIFSGNYAIVNTYSSGLYSATYFINNPYDNTILIPHVLHNDYIPELGKKQAGVDYPEQDLLCDVKYEYFVPKYYKDIYGMGKGLPLQNHKILFCDSLKGEYASSLSHEGSQLKETMGAEWLTANYNESYKMSGPEIEFSDIKVSIDDSSESYEDYDIVRYSQQEFEDDFLSQGNILVDLPYSNLITSKILIN